MVILPPQLFERCLRLWVPRLDPLRGEGIELFLRERARRGGANGITREHGGGGSDTLGRRLRRSRARAATADDDAAAVDVAADAYAAADDIAAISVPKRHLDLAPAPKAGPADEEGFERIPEGTLGQVHEEAEKGRQDGQTEARPALTGEHVVGNSNAQDECGREQR